MLHNRRLIARSCPIKSIDLGPSPDNYVRTVSNGSIYLALRSSYGCKVSDAILCESEPVWHFPWQCDIVPGPRVLTYQPHCPVLCPNMSQCHETSDITSHTPGHLTSHCLLLRAKTFSKDWFLQNNVSALHKIFFLIETAGDFNASPWVELRKRLGSFIMKWNCQFNVNWPVVIAIPL